MEDQDIDPDIMNMVAAMCGDYSDMDNDHKDERYRVNTNLESAFNSRFIF